MRNKLQMHSFEEPRFALSGRIRRSAAPADHSEDAAGAGREAVGMFV